KVPGSGGLPDSCFGIAILPGSIHLKWCCPRVFAKELVRSLHTDGKSAFLQFPRDSKIVVKRIRRPGSGFLKRQNSFLSQLTFRPFPGLIGWNRYEILRQSLKLSLVDLLHKCVSLDGL